MSDAPHRTCGCASDRRAAHGSGIALASGFALALAVVVVLSGWGWGWSLVTWPLAGPLACGCWIIGAPVAEAEAEARGERACCPAAWSPLTGGLPNV